MPEPVAEPALNGLRLNLRIVSIVMFNFASYLTIGLPLAVLPGYVHDAMGFSAFWAGLIISLQYFATLLSRPHAGRYADVLGPKKSLSLAYAAVFKRTRLPAGGYRQRTADDQFVATGAGSRDFGDWAKFCRHRFDTVGRRCRQVVAYWSGHLTERYRHLRRNGDGRAAGRAVLCPGGLQGLALTVMGVALLAVLLALPRPSVKANKGKPLPFRAVLGRVWLYGMALALASAGFGVIATFITLFYDAKGWDGAPLRSRYLASRLSARVCCS